MNEVANIELDERLQKQVRQAREALKKGGSDFTVQVCGELLKKYPGAFEVRALLWEALQKGAVQKESRLGWLKARSSGLQFKMAHQSLLKKDPLKLVRACDGQLRNKEKYVEIFHMLDKAAEALGWPETSVQARQVMVQLEPGKLACRLALAEKLVQVRRPQQAIEQVEWVLAREPANGEAQTLLKNASVAETLQRGNWEDTDTTFHTKKQS